MDLGILQVAVAQVDLADVLHGHELECAPEKPRLVSQIEVRGLGIKRTHIKLVVPQLNFDGFSGIPRKYFSLD